MSSVDVLEHGLQDFRLQLLNFDPPCLGLRHAVLEHRPEDGRAGTEEYPMAVEYFIPADDLDVGKFLVIYSKIEISRKLLGRFEALLSLDILQLFESRYVGFLLCLESHIADNGEFVLGQQLRGGRTLQHRVCD